MRPRDFLTFVHRSIEVAINRGHKKVTSKDLIDAELLFSEDLLKAMTFEISDVLPEYPELLYEFLECSVSLRPELLNQLLNDAGVPASKVIAVRDLLVWFGFLGITRQGEEEARYSHSVRYDMVKLLHPIERREGLFVVHPAFRSALECK